MPIKLVIDCETGITTEVELTAEEIAQREADAVAWAEEQAQREAQAAVQADAKASAESKLSALGLNTEEIAALLNK